MKEIPKVLLSAVIGKPVVHMKDNTSLNPRGIDVVYRDDVEIKFGDTVRVKAVNIHEFGDMCKLWAIKKNYTIDSVIKHTQGHARVGWYEKNHTDQHGSYFEQQFYSDWFKADDNNEPEAVMKACEWILKATK